MTGDQTLSQQIKKTIEASAAQNSVFVSAISVWEIAMLVNKGKIVLNSPCLVWINSALSLPGITLIPLSPEIAVESCQLPGELHGGPADRILAATSIIEDLTLITRDRKLLEYGAKKFISTKAA